MTFRIINADVIDGLRSLPDESVHCVVTSPPYWGLRDYGVAGQIGLERTPQEFVARMVEVFAEVRRVLRFDGVCFMNLGDSYNAYNGGAGPGSKLSGNQTKARPKLESGYGIRAANLKPKDLIGIPWRVALALQDDGWWLRGDYIWHKPNPMPESVTDRCTKAHEYVFHLTKSERYFWDQEAIKETAIYAGDVKKTNGAAGMGAGYDGHRTRDGFARGVVVPDTRNKRSVWTIATSPFPEAHFATFPPELPDICIKAGCPVGGTVLDPFSGAGTTCLVADRLQRNGIGIELNPEYAAMSEARIGRDRGGLLDLMEAAE